MPSHIFTVLMPLTGLIQNSETPGLIDLVKDVVTSNIEGDNTMILIAIPMSGMGVNLLCESLLSPTLSDDIENQQAVRLAKEADPAGKRTIGSSAPIDTSVPLLIIPQVCLRSPMSSCQLLSGNCKNGRTC